MGAEFFVGVEVTAFAHQEEIEFAEQVGERKGIVDFKGGAVMSPALDFVAAGFRCGGLAGGPASLKESFGTAFYRVGDLGRRVNRTFEDQAGFGSPRKKEANDPAVFHGMRSEQRERIGKARGEECI